MDYRFPGALSRNARNKVHEDRLASYHHAVTEVMPYSDKRSLPVTVKGHVEPAEGSSGPDRFAGTLSARCSEAFTNPGGIAEGYIRTFHGGTQKTSAYEAMHVSAGGVKIQALKPGLRQRATE